MSPLSLPIGTSVLLLLISVYPDLHLFITVYPVFKNEKYETNGSSKKLFKKDHKTNIIATNFIREQLKTVALTSSEGGFE